MGLIGGGKLAVHVDANPQEGSIALPSHGLFQRLGFGGGGGLVHSWGDGADPT
jgi:hypothetical protein